MGRWWARGVTKATLYMGQIPPIVHRVHHLRLVRKQGLACEAGAKAFESHQRESVKQEITSIV